MIARLSIGLKSSVHPTKTNSQEWFLHIFKSVVTKDLGILGRHSPVWLGNLRWTKVSRRKLLRNS